MTDSERLFGLAANGGAGGNFRGLGLLFRRGDAPAAFVTPVPADAQAAVESALPLRAAWAADHPDLLAECRWLERQAWLGARGHRPGDERRAPPGELDRREAAYRADLYARLAAAGEDFDALYRSQGPRYRVVAAAGGYVIRYAPGTGMGWQNSSGGSSYIGPAREVVRQADGRWDYLNISLSADSYLYPGERDYESYQATLEWLIETGRVPELRRETVVAA